MTEQNAREVRVCAITGQPVEMLYDGTNDSGNGNPGWLCLHDIHNDISIAKLINDVYEEMLSRISHGQPETVDESDMAYVEPWWMYINGIVSGRPTVELNQTKLEAVAKSLGI